MIMNTEQVMWASFINLVGVFPMYVINFMVGKIMTLMFLLEDFLTTMEKCCPCPINADSVGTIQS